FEYKYGIKNPAFKPVQGRNMTLLSINPSRAPFCGLAPPQAQARRRPFPQNLAAETEKLGRPPPGRRGKFAGSLHQALFRNQAAEILLVEPESGQGFDGALQFQQGKS